MADRLPSQRLSTDRPPATALELGPTVLLALAVALTWCALVLALDGAGRTVVVVVGLLALNALAAWFLGRWTEPDEDEPVIPGQCTRRPHR